jgi:hypothetical protein
MDPLERPPPGTGPSSVPAVSKLQTGSQAAGQSIDGRLPSVTSVLAMRARSLAVRCGLLRGTALLIGRADPADLHAPQGNE